MNRLPLPVMASETGQPPGKLRLHHYVSFTMPNSVSGNTPASSPSPGSTERKPTFLRTDLARLCPRRPKLLASLFQDSHTRTTHYGSLPQKSQHGRTQDENPVVHFFKNIVSDHIQGDRESIKGRLLDPRQSLDRLCLPGILLRVQPT